MTLAGCLNMEPSPDNTQFHVLNSATRGFNAPAEQRVVIRNVKLIDYLETGKVVQRTSPSSVRYLNDHWWAGQLDEMIAHAVAANLEASHSGVYATTGSSAQSGKLIDLNVMQFELTHDGGAIVTLEYRVTEAGKGTISREGRVSQAWPATGQSTEDAIGSLQELLKLAVGQMDTGV
jgi:uncharacterized lipoprotein YmbA